MVGRAIRRTGVPLVLVLSRCLAAGALTASAATAAPTVTVAGSSPFAACQVEDVPDIPKGDAKFLNAEMEPYLAVDPRSAENGHGHLIGAWMQDIWSPYGARGIVAASSFDGGATWTRSSIPFSACASPDTYDYLGVNDPWVSIGPDGTAYATALGLNTTTNGVVAATSTDGGKTWGNYTAIQYDSNNDALNDKETVEADPVKSGVAYAVWSRLTRPQLGLLPSKTWFSRTDDGGQTWSDPRAIVSVPNGEAAGNQIVVDPRSGALYDIFVHITATIRTKTVCTKSKGHTICKKKRRISSLHFAIADVRSTDGGETWSKPHDIASAFRPGGGVSVSGTHPKESSGELERTQSSMPVRTGSPVPSAAIDPTTGRLYVAWGYLGSTQAAFASSGDGGSTWSAPNLIKSSATDEVFNPSIAVDAHGTAGLAYYTTNMFGSTHATEYWFRSSSDFGKTFSDPVHLGGPFNISKAPAFGGYFLGDYQGLAADSNSFHSLFVMTTKDDKNRTDVYATTVVP